VGVEAGATEILVDMKKYYPPTALSIPTGKQ
jgi:hypothetical protein